MLFIVYIYNFFLLLTQQEVYTSGIGILNFFSQDIGSIFWFLSDDSAHSILSSDISPSRTF